MSVLRVATHNVCHLGYNPLDGTQLFPDGKYRFGYEADTVERMVKNWKAVYSSFTADLVAVQEHFFWMDQAHDIITEKEIYNNFGYEVEDGNMGLAVAAKFPLEKVYELSFEPISERRRQKFYIEVDGKRIAVFNSHPSPKDKNLQLRKKEYALLLEEYKREPYFIACGDYNAATAEEFAMFADAGFPMANTGLGTVIHTGHTCDNIIVSPNIQIEQVALYDREFSLSDHMVLYAELSIH